MEKGGEYGPSAHEGKLSSLTVLNECKKADEIMNLKPNQIIDNRYEIIEKLGEGGMGAVWKARHATLGDEVVLKMPLFQNDAEMLRRFGKEAQTMRKHSIESPHILNIDDVGVLNGVPWYVMRFLPGGSVRP